ncbi:hypothetical protein, partial [Nocardia asiatica]|uniref:hypothetical protein n=1 Tax=Nocardia asiatica TaxID=209252 RepID=UPI002455CF5C
GGGGGWRARVGSVRRVFFAIGLVAAELGVVSGRGRAARGGIGEDTTTRARAAGAQLSKAARARRWRNRSHSKPNNHSAGGGGCSGGGCAGGE